MKSHIGQHKLMHYLFLLYKECDNSSSTTSNKRAHATIVSKLRNLRLVLLHIELICMPGNDINVYLSPLVEELSMLWYEDIDVFDRYNNQNFKMRGITQKLIGGTVLRDIKHALYVNKAHPTIN
ncbi:hypothetical protein CR513_18424, partial [Mucuna pruriens]